MRAPKAELLGRLAQVRRALNAIERVGVEECVDDLPVDLLAAAAALCGELRARLGQVETTLLWRLGREKGKHYGTLPDGRGYEIARNTDRKEWDHEEWQRDVRRVLVANTVEALGTETVYTLDGEEIVLPELLQAVVTASQAVHSGGPPKTRDGLAKLGLYASDYSTSTPAGWRMKVDKPKRRSSYKFLPDTLDEPI